MTFIQQLENYYRAAYPYIWVNTFEEQRVTQEIVDHMLQAGRRVSTWCVATGKLDTRVPREGLPTAREVTTAPVPKLVEAIFNAAKVTKEGGHIFVLYDLHDVLEKNAGFIRAFRAVTETIKQHNPKIMVVVAVAGLLASILIFAQGVIGAFAK